MDCQKVGKLIYDLRTENNFTQKQLADKLNISDRTVSKWERGLGCPDVSLLGELSEIFKVNIEKILLGDLNPNEEEGDNMKKIKFYVCPICGNVITSMSNAEISCCGRKLTPLEASKADESHELNIGTAENDFYITFLHPMTKEHFIGFVTYVTFDSCITVCLYPEQSGEVRFPKLHGGKGGKFYYYCSKHGLFSI